jgi:hypothetical protein
MRSYVFTDRERRILRSFLDGRIPINDPGVEQIRSRIKSFTELRNDIDLYIRFREAITTQSA